MKTSTFEKPTHAATQSKLRQYVDLLDEKIAEAKWKQNMILKFSYQPLNHVKDKIDEQRQKYMKKMDQEKQKNLLQYNDEIVNHQIQMFRGFREKLEDKMRQIQIKIDEKIMKKVLLSEKVQEKKERLKMTMRENLKIIKTFSQNSSFQKKIESASNKVERKDSKKELFSQKVSTNCLLTLKYQQEEPNSDIFLFQECLKVGFSSIQHLNSSDDIQQGIFLEIMNKKRRKIPTYSKKSSICNVLLERYRDFHKIHKKKFKNSSNDDFSMNWNTFKNLNWKQIMGIILMQDRQGKKIKLLLK